jgi:hypothetical protein
LDVGRGSHGDDAVSRHSHGFGLRLCGIHGPNLAVDENKVGIGLGHKTAGKR